MDIALTLDKIEMLIKPMSEADNIERLHHYATIRTILNDLKKHTKETEDLKNTPNVNIYITEMDSPLKCLAGLLDHGHDDDTYSARLYGAIDKLRSVHCYDTK